MFEKLLSKLGYIKFSKASSIVSALVEQERFAVKPSVANRQAFEKCIWVFIAIREIAQAIAGIPLRVGLNQNGTWEEKPNSRPAKLFQNPNPFLTRYDLWERIAVDLELFGNAYLEIVKDDQGIPVEVYPLRPDRVEIEGHPKRFISRYYYIINGRKLPVGGWPPDEIVHFRTANPASEFYGLSPIKPLDVSLQLDLYALLFNRRFFEAGARIGGVLETDYTLSKETEERLQAWFAENFTGYQAAFVVPVLQSGLKYKQVRETHKEMEFIEQRKVVREEILGTFGVPPAMVGLFETANYASAYVQKELFYVDTIVPKLLKIQERLNKSLLSQFGPGWEARFSLEDIPALREKEETKAKVYAQYVAAGILTPDEVRAKEGYPPLKREQLELFPEKVKKVISARRYTEKPKSTDRKPIPIVR